MNARERFVAVMNFQPCDRTMLWEFGYWAGTLRRWYGEGLSRRHGVREALVAGDTVIGEAMASAHSADPEFKKLFPVKDKREMDVHECLGLDSGLVLLPINSSLCPAFPPAVVEEGQDTRQVMDGFGVVKEVRKDGQSIPRFLRWPVETRDDFENLKPRLQANFAARVPENWDELVAAYQTRDFPLLVGSCGEGFFGNLRRLMGEIRLFTAYYDDPELLKHMNGYFADLWISLWDQAFHYIKPDVAWFWEDMCYRNGPLISADLFREFMSPYYKRITGFLEDHGVKIRLVDTDGDCWKLLPVFMEAGITGLSPFEVNSGMDVVEVRKAFPRLQILGGLDKQVIARGPEAIEMELSSKLPAMLEKGGYIPHVDHLVPPDVSWASFKYYRDRLKDYVCQ